MPLVVSYNIAITPFKNQFDDSMVTSGSAFDAIMTKYALESSTSAIQDFKRVYDCPGYDGRSSRYKQSTFCYLVDLVNPDSQEKYLL